MKEENFLKEYDSDIRYVSKKGFTELCNKYNISFSDGEKLTSTIRRSRPTHPETAVFNAILEQDAGLSDYYRG